MTPTQPDGSAAGWASAPAKGGRKAELALPGRNCWRIARADRVAFLIDGEEYYLALRDALRGARRSIVLVGWEFDSRVRLERAVSGGDDAEGDCIGPLLDRLVRRNPDLEAHVLIWDSALIYAFNREMAGLAKMRFMTHRRLHYRLDDSHPIGASHHQKIVVIDDCLAFIGGMDVASERWDTRFHHSSEPRRSDDAVASYPPFHDAMALVTGDAAAALGELCRQRWCAATGEVLSPCAPMDWRPLWPARARPALKGVDVALARTRPSWDEWGEAREIETLYLDMIAAARHGIYIENQYFASRRIASALAGRLASPGCPEIVVVTPGEPASLVERSTMGVARARLYRELKQVDCAGRLKLYHPVNGGTDIKVHSKLMIVDDRMARIGSANLNNRSMGLDTECDLFIESRGDAGIGDAIAALRRDLLAEHLGTNSLSVAEAEARHGGMIGAIAALSAGERRLIPLDSDEPRNVVHMIADSRIPDPEEPVETLVWIEESMPGPAKRPLQVRVWTLTALLAGLAALGMVWRWVPFDLWQAMQPALAWAAGLNSSPGTVAAIAALFLLGGLARVPVSLLVLLTGALFGILGGAVIALAGAVASAVLLFGLGRLMGRAQVRRIAGWQVNRVHRALSRHGIMAIMVLRLMPVAAFSVINMVAGATGVSLRDFVIGTVIGMAPGVFAMSVLGDRLVAVLSNPTPVNVAILAGATVVVVVAVFALVDRVARVRARR